MRSSRSKSSNSKSSRSTTGVPKVKVEKRKLPRVTDKGGVKAENEEDGDGGGSSSVRLERVEDLAPVFVSQYHVVKHIFEYLRIADVLRGTLVNKQWAEIGQRVRKQRKNLPYTILYHPYSPSHKLAFEYFNGFNGEVSEEANQLIRFWSKERQPIRTWRYQALSAEARSTVTKAFLDSYDEPQLLIAFGTAGFYKGVTSQNNRNEEPLNERMKLVLEDVQNIIPCITNISCGVVATLPDTYKALELEKNTYPCLSCLAVPKVQGLRVKMFQVTVKQNKKLKGETDIEAIKNVLGIDNENEDKLKGIVFIQKATYRPPPIVNAIRKYIRTKPNVALGGGIHDMLFLSGVPDDTVLAGGMLIYGDENVRVSSIALEEAKISPNNQKKIDQLKASMIPNGNSFAIMFACNGRGTDMHDRPNVESDLFNSHFPTTPLVGSFTLGEFCHEVVSTGSNDPMDPPKKIDFTFTTVFVLVSYKHPSETQDGK